VHDLDRGREVAMTTAIETIRIEYG